MIISYHIINNSNTIESFFQKNDTLVEQEIISTESSDILPDSEIVPEYIPKIDIKSNLIENTPYSKTSANKSICTKKSIIPHSEMIVNDNNIQAKKIIHKKSSQSKKQTNIQSKKQTNIQSKKQTNIQSKKQTNIQSKKQRKTCDIPLIKNIINNNPSDIEKRLHIIENKLKNNTTISGKNTTKPVENNTAHTTLIENKKYLNTERKIRKKINIQSDFLNKKLYNLNDISNYNNIHFKNNDIHKNINDHNNFEYKNDISFTHIQPTKDLASSVGWTYIPPQYWSIPQKRPPVCIPKKGTESTVKPFLDKGTPINSLDWNTANVKLENNKLKYNPNYYYPGWIVQDVIKYPSSNNGSTFTNNYWNYNKAIKTSKKI